MFQNQISSGVNDFPGKHLVRNPVQSFNGIRRICKHDIEFLVADFKEVKYIVSDYRHILQAELLGL